MTPRSFLILSLILLVGALVRGLYLSELVGSPETYAPALDAAFHDHWARALLSGDWSPPQFFADPQIHTTPFFRPPGYPYFLAGIYALTSDPLGVRVLQMLLGLLNIILGYFAGRALFGEAVGRISAAGMAVFWILPYFEGELLAPVLLVTLVLLQILVWQRWLQRGGWTPSLLAGVLLGLFALTRPNALLLLPVLFFWFWKIERGGQLEDNQRQQALNDTPLESGSPRIASAPQRSLRSALLGLPLGLLLTVLPATVRNYVVAGEPVLITANAGVNLYIGNNPEADGYTARIPILGELAGLPGWTCFDQPRIRQAVSRLEGREFSATEVSNFFASQALDFALEEPGHALALAAKKAALFWGPAEISNNREIQIVRDESAVLRYLPGFATLLSFALLGAIRLGLERRRLGRSPTRALSVLLLLVVAVYFASHLPFFVAGRYRVPLVPILMLFAAFGIERLFADLRARPWRNTAPWALGWLAALVLAHVPLVHYEPDIGQYHFQRGDAYRMQGEPAAAEREYRLAIARDPDPGPVPHNNLGALLTQQGRLREALEQLQLAVQLAPRYLSAQVNLSVAWLRAQQPARAIQALEAAVQIEPEQAELRERLGALLLQAGRPQDAIPELAFAAQRTQRPETRYLWAAALADTGARAEAKAILQELVRETPFAPAQELLRALPDR